MLSFLPEGIDRYVVTHSTPEPPLFEALAEATRAGTDQPQMQVGLVEGMFLKLLARSMGARRVLEIGSFTGYSTLMLAEGVAPEGEVITCDIDRKATRIARKHWEQSPAGERIRLELGRALDSLGRIEGPFDLVFIDADKENYVRYWEACVPKVRKAGVLLVDNVLWSGRVLDPQEPDDRAIAAFNEHVLADNRVELVMLTIRDGLTLACKR